MEAMKSDIKKKSVIHPKEFKERQNKLQIV